METVRASKTKTRGLNDKLSLSLEDYLLLIQSHSHLHLTVPHLNQIISMHGYKKLHKVPKKLLNDAVSTLTLVAPSRSTLREYISPLVITTINDVVADLDQLNWKECCVTSIETLSSWQNAHSSPLLTSPRQDDVVRYNKHQQLSEPLALDSRPFGAVSAPDGASLPYRASESVLHPAKKLAPKRKRKTSPRGSGCAHAALDSVSYGSC